MSDEQSTNLEVVTHVLTMGRLDGGWDDENVAIMVLLNLGLDPHADVANPWNSDPEIGAKEFRAKRDAVMLKLAQERHVQAQADAEAAQEKAADEAQVKTDSETIADMQRRRQHDAESERRQADADEARRLNEEAEAARLSQEQQDQEAEKRIAAARKQAEQDEADKAGADQEGERRYSLAREKSDEAAKEQNARSKAAVDKLKADAEAEAQAKADAAAAEPAVDGAKGNPDQKTTIDSSEAAAPVKPSSEATPDAFPSAPVPPPPAWAGEGKPIEETGSKAAS